MKYFVWIAIIFVAAVIIGAFFFIGSPLEQRQMRFDERRLSDLQNIQYQVASYYGTKGRLPAALADMTGFEGFSVPVDPETGADYEYSVQASDKFRLCANFALPSEEDVSGRVDSLPYPYATKPYAGGDQSWKHPAGRGCFDLLMEKPNLEQGYPPSITVKPVAS